jgi:hypothetical protein
MRKKIDWSIFAVVAALLVVFGLSSHVEALPITLNSGESATFLYDGATASPVCTLCDASVTLTFNGDSLQISFANTSTDNLIGVNVLTQFAFNSSPNLSFGSATFSGLPAGKDWLWKTNGLGGFEFGSDTVNGINDGLEANESGSVLVSISSPTRLTSLQIDSTDTHFQAINVLNGTSTKPDGCVAGVEANCGSTSQVPEPTSWLLLGVGLVFVAGRLRSHN